MSAVQLSPEVVLVALLHHGDDHDEEEGEEPALRADGGVYHPGEDKGDLISWKYFVSWN